MGLTDEGVNASYVMLLDPTTETPIGSGAAPMPVTGTLVVSDEWTLAASRGSESGNERWWDVPSTQEWQLLWLKIKYTSAAAAGTRQVVLHVQHAGATIQTELARAGATQIESLARYYLLAPGVADLTAFRDTDYLTTPIPVTSILVGSDRLRVFDNNGISGTDQIDYWLQYAYRTV